jgi:tetratricopeptide (TPR) repeat protein
MQRTRSSISGGVDSGGGLFSLCDGLRGRPMSNGGTKPSTAPGGSRPPPAPGKASFGSAFPTLASASPSGMGAVPPLSSSHRLGSGLRVGTASQPQKPPSATTRPSATQEQQAMPPVRRPPSTGSQQNNLTFHKGLVNALHDVLRRQRSGLFPGPTGQDAESSAPVAPMPLPHPVSRDRDTVEELVKQKKVEWAQRRWNASQQKQRRDMERELSTKTAHAEETVDDDGGEFDFDVMEQVGILERDERRRRETIASQADALFTDMFGNFSLAMNVKYKITRSTVRQPIGSNQNAFGISGAAEELRHEGNEMYKKGDFCQAYHLYSLAVDADPTSPVLLTNRAAASMMLMNYEAAAKDCLLVISIDATNFKAFARLAKASALLGQYRTAIKHYSVAKQLCPPDPARLQEEADAVPHLERLRKLVDTEEYEQAVEKLSLVRSFAADPPVQVLRYHALIHTDPAAARGEIAKHLSTIEHPNPTNSGDMLLTANLSNHYCDMLVMLAKASFYCGQHFMNIAASYARQCLQLRPEFRPASSLLRIITSLETKISEVQQLNHAGRPAEALLAISAAIGIDPQNRKIRSTLFVLRAEMHSKTGNTSAAISDCNSAIEADPTHVKALARRSKCFAELGDFPRAIVDMERAVELNPSLRDELAALRSRQDEDMSSFSSFQRKFSAGTRRGSAGPSADPNDAFRSRPSTGALPRVKCHYEVLGLAKFATAEQVKAQYKRLILQYHPDKVVSQSEENKSAALSRFKEISQAYQILSDAAQKLQYDRSVGCPG